MSHIQKRNKSYSPGLRRHDELRASAVRSECAHRRDNGRCSTVVSHLLHKLISSLT